jgi:hypothetical protein
MSEYKFETCLYEVASRLGAISSLKNPEQFVRVKFG